MHKSAAIVAMFGLLLPAAALAQDGGDEVIGPRDDREAAEAIATVESDEVRGVNPADILSRADIVVKVVNLEQGQSVTTVAKYDQKLGDGLGASAELPFASYVDVGAADAFGVGDLFLRLRYVKPLSQSIIALVSVEAVAPIATNDLLGTGKWQLNPGGGVVKIWSPKMFTAAVYKHSFSVAGDDARAEINANSARLIHSFILDKGYYLTLDGRHEWQSTGLGEDWTTTEIEVGRQFNASLAASLRIGKAYGDRANDGSLELNVRTFF
jgi:hypothetical protein